MSAPSTESGPSLPGAIGNGATNPGDSIVEASHDDWGDDTVEDRQELRPADGRDGSSREGPPRSGGAAIGTIGLIALAAGAAAFTYAWTSSPKRRPGHARGRDPGDNRISESADRGSSNVAAAEVLIDAPARRLYRLWRDYSNFDAFMPDVIEVSARPGDDRVSDWTVKGPGGTKLWFVSRIVADEPGERIAWRADGAPGSHDGEVCFTDTNRGTRVRLELDFSRAGSGAGLAVARLLGKATGQDPEQQARKALKRLKQLVETGEIARVAPRAHRQGQSA